MLNVLGSPMQTLNKISLNENLTILDRSWYLSIVQALYVLL